MMARPAYRRPQDCCRIAHTEVVEDYLKALFHLSTGRGAATAATTTSAVAVRLDVAAPTVSAMLKRLQAQGLVRRSRDHQVELTEHGLRHALGVVRRHRLLEMFLAEVLHVPWDEVHAEAEVLEHALSARLEERIDALLGSPTHDPHGDPIPPKSGRHVEDWASPLAEAPARCDFRVDRVRDVDSGALRSLGALGIVPGAVLHVGKWAPYGGPLEVEVAGQRHALGPGLVQVVHGHVVHEQAG